MKIKYLDLPLGPRKLAVIKQANAIIADYRRQGFDLTLRQLYYQFVARDLIPNRVQEYKRLGDIVNDGRLAGLIDWDAIVDRTRNLRLLAHWSSPGNIVESSAQQFRYDRWATQPHRIEVWIEKDALVGVIEDVCDDLDVPYFSCRGYTSQSEMWAASQRLKRYAQRPKNPQTPIILHFGDHDPSGIDMTRDIEDRLAMFMGGVEVRRLALNMGQVNTFNPPPNPAKTTDSRYKSYIQLYGHESWELDALEPRVLAQLIRDEIDAVIDGDAWAEEDRRQLDARSTLGQIAARFDDVRDFLNTGESE